MTRLVLLALCTLCVLPAGDSTGPVNHQVNVTVRPGSMGVQFSKENLRDGDSVTVTLQPAKDYIIKRSRVSDPLLLGWRKVSNHVFELKVKNPPTDKDWQNANFNGTLVRIGSPGAGDSSVTEDELPFDFDGRVKRVGGDEGVSSDFNRKPPGKLHSVIGNCPETPTGMATLNRSVKDGVTYRELIGSFRHGNSLFMGEYQGEVKLGDGVKENPVYLGSEQGPSPGGTGNTVTIAYHGAKDGAGGVASGEQILYNTWKSKTAAAKAAADAAEAAVTAATTALNAAQTALTEARKAAQDAAKAAADAKQAVEDLIGAIVKKEADNLAAARTALATALEAITKAEDAIAKAKQALATAKKGTAAWRIANKALQDATAAKTKAEADKAALTKQIPKLEEAVTKAREKAAQDKGVIAAQAEAERLAGLARQAEAAVTAAGEAVTAAEEGLRTAQAEFARLHAEYIEAAADEQYYQEALAGLLGHERQHRDILRDHVRMLTDLLAKLRSIGWSPDPAKAVTLSHDYWKVCVAALERDIQGRELAAQQKFDRDTNHGRN